MTRAAPLISLRREAVVLPTLAPAAAPLPLVARGAPAPALAATRRTRLWEFNGNLHCSIVGTCLSTAELRQILTKFGLAQPSATDHDLHGTAVLAAGRHDAPAKRLHKALDQRHRLAINRFAKAATEAELREAWRDSVKQGDIPGAYWAALTHPAATGALIREAFGEVHMLSHLVGSANRADISRLRMLEAERAAMQERLDRQQAQLRDAIVSRDKTIRALQDALAARAASDGAPGAASDGAAAVPDEVLRQLVLDRERRLGSETRRREATEARLADAQARGRDATAACVAAQQEAARLREELAAVEAGLRLADDEGNGPAAGNFGGVSVLYVGGRPGEAARLRALGARLGASLLHHDGGIEESTDLLAGLASRADLVVFPVDCISHPAALLLKRLCRQSGKPYVPLRSSGATSFLAALCRTAVAHRGTCEEQARLA